MLALLLLGAGGEGISLYTGEILYQLYRLNFFSRSEGSILFLKIVSDLKYRSLLCMADLF